MGDGGVECGYERGEGGGMEVGEIEDHADEEKSFNG
jgi:hypothetical protein